MLRGGHEQVEARLKPRWIRTVRRPPWHRNRVTVEALQAGRQHRAVDLVQQACGDVHDTRLVDAEQVAVVGEMVDRAERDPVTRGDPSALRSLDDVQAAWTRGALRGEIAQRSR